MNTMIASSGFSTTAVSGILAMPLPDTPFEEAGLEIYVPAFGLGLTAALIEAGKEIDSGTLSLSVGIDQDVAGLISLAGVMIENGRKFRVKEVGWQIEIEAETARAEFVASTLRAIFSLAGVVRFQIPELAIKYELNFESSLPQISKMLQRRQAAFRVMVIEQATDQKFLWPGNISGEDIETISFLYQAITDHHCIWPLDETVSLFLSATAENLEWLSLKQPPARYQFPATQASRELWGQVIPLGHEIVIVEDGIVERREEVLQEMSANDGHVVSVEIRSLSGQISYELPEALRMPAAPWDAEIQPLIDLEEKLALELAARYHALAASTLAHLTEEEKAEITSRPELDEDAYLMTD